MYTYPLESQWQSTILSIQLQKRAKTTSLLNSGATENFLNLDYAKWLQLPIKKMLHPQKLFNIDGTENKAGQL